MGILASQGRQDQVPDKDVFLTPKPRTWLRKVLVVDYLKAAGLGGRDVACIEPTGSCIGEPVTAAQKCLQIGKIQVLKDIILLRMETWTRASYWKGEVSALTTLAKFT